MAKEKAKSGTEPTGEAVMAAGAAEQNTDNVAGANPADNVDAKAKNTKPEKAAKVSDGDRIDAIIDLLAANGMSLPKALAPPKAKEKPEAEPVEPEPADEG